MSDDDAAAVIVTVFRSRLHPEAAERGYHHFAEAMEHRARGMPGFLNFKTFAAEDGERVSIVEFDSLEHHNGWRDDPAHRLAQHRGREEFYTEYQVVVGQVLRRRSSP